MSASSSLPTRFADLALGYGRGLVHHQPRLPLKPVPVARFDHQATGMPVDPLRSSEAFEAYGTGFDTEQKSGHQELDLPRPNA